MAFWNIFQSSADKIKKWDFDEATKAKLQSLSDALPKVVRDFLIAKVTWLFTSVTAKFGKDFVQGIFERVIEFLKTALENFKKK